MVNIITTKRQREKMVELAIAGYQIDKICSKFKKIPRYTILATIRKAGIKIKPTVKYCKICGSLIENDVTKNHTKILCSPKCIKESEKIAARIYHKKYYKKKGYIGQLKKYRKKNFPTWRCENGHEQPLIFDPRANFTSQLIKDLRCKICYGK